MTPHEMAKDRFDHAVARRINEESAAGTFNALVIVAPAHVLGEVEPGLDVPTRAKLLGTVAKDLVHVPDHDLQPHVKDWVRPVHRA